MYQTERSLTELEKKTCSIATFKICVDSMKIWKIVTWENIYIYNHIATPPDVFSQGLTGDKTIYITDFYLNNFGAQAVKKKEPFFNRSIYKPQILINILCESR